MGEALDRAVKKYEDAVREAERLEAACNLRHLSNELPTNDPRRQVLEKLRWLPPEDRPSGDKNNSPGNQGQG